MGLKKLSAKVADYQARLERGAAQKIKRDHVQTVLDKLRGKEAELVAARARASDPEKAERLERKIAIAREQILRADWLLKQIG